MKLYFLGTGAALPGKKRNVSSTALLFRNNNVLVDCGEGTQRQIQWCNFSFMKISHVFITHFHLDHILGLFGLMESMKLNDRKKALNIVGPSGIRKLIDDLISIGLIKRDFPLRTTKVSDGSEIGVNGMTVKSFENTHGPNSLGYVFEEHTRPGKFDKEKALELGIPEGPLYGMLQRGREIEVNGRTIAPDRVLGPPRPGLKVVFSGDTYRCPRLVEVARNADVLVHEATYGDKEKGKAREYLHSTAKIAAEAAEKAEVRNLFLNHISTRYEKADVLLMEARQIFEESYLAKDLLEVQVHYRDSDRDIRRVDHSETPPSYREEGE